MNTTTENQLRQEIDFLYEDLDFCEFDLMETPSESLKSKCNEIKSMIADKKKQLAQLIA